VCAAKANGEDESGNPLKLKGLYKKFGDGYKNGRAPEPRAEAAADELNNPLELRLFLFLLELLLDFQSFSICYHSNCHHFLSYQIEN
jgi:hypothetical protein